MNHDDYHNILSEEFPSPIRHDANPLPPLPEHSIEEHDTAANGEDPVEQPGAAVPDASAAADASQQQQQQTQQDLDASSVNPPNDSILTDHPWEHQSPNGHGVEAAPYRPDSHSPRGASSPHPPEASGSVTTPKKRHGHKHLQMTEEERKERQRAQNREAAQRSRANKAKDLEKTEAANKALQDEVNSLRSRLADLQTTRTGAAEADETAVAPTQTASAPTETQIDYLYHGRLKYELQASRDELFALESDLLKLRGVDLAPTTAPRKALLSRLTDQSYLQAETSAWTAIEDQMNNEKGDLRSRADDILAEMERRKNHVQEVDQPMGDEAEGDTDARLDKSLMDIGGWVDAAVRDWQQSEEVS